MMSVLCHISDISKGYDFLSILLRIFTTTSLYIILSYINTSIIWDKFFRKVTTGDVSNTTNYINLALINKLYEIMFRVLLNISIVFIILEFFNMSILRAITTINVLYIISKTLRSKRLRLNKLFDQISELIHRTNPTNIIVSSIAFLMSIIALVYVILPIVDKTYLVGNDIKIHFAIIDNILSREKITAYLDKYDMMLTYSPGLHSSYAYLVYITNNVVNIFCFPLLIYGIYFLFALLLTLLIYTITKSILRSILAMIVATMIVPLAIGFAFFPAPHIFAFCFSVLVLVSLYTGNPSLAIMISLLILLVHPVDAIAQILLVLSFIIAKGSNIFNVIIKKMKMFSLQFTYIFVTVLILFYHFINVFHSTDNLIFYSTLAKYEAILSRNKQILYNILNSKFDIFNYSWYTRINNLYISQLFILLLLTYVVLCRIKRIKLRKVLSFNKYLLNSVIIWHIATFSLLITSVALNLYLLMPTSFNRIISYSLLLVLISIWSVRVLTNRKIVIVLFEIAILLTIIGAKALPITVIKNTYAIYAKRVEGNSISILDPIACDEIRMILNNNTNATIVIQFNAPLSVATSLFRVDRIILLIPGALKKEISSLPQTILVDPSIARKVMIKNNISYYIAYFPQRNDSWITRYTSRLLFGNITNPYRLYLSMKYEIEKHFVILYDKYNYLIIAPRRTTS